VVRDSGVAEGRGRQKDARLAILNDQDLEPAGAVASGAIRTAA
jgi:hypothetical protein